MGVVDWRAWTNQNGGQMPTAPNPPGTPYVTNSPFPGVGPIGIGATPGPPGTQVGLIDGAQSFPAYANVPTTIKPTDPFSGWTDQQEFFFNRAYPPPTGVHPPTMRPAIPGLTSP